MELGQIEKLTVDEKLALIDAIHDTFCTDMNAELSAEGLEPSHFQQMSIEQRLDLCDRIQLTIEQQEYPPREVQIQRLEAEKLACANEGPLGRPEDEVFAALQRGR